MLRQDVIDAVAEGEFHIWAVNTIDEGIALLTGHEAGEPDEEGLYPEGTVNRKVADRLVETAKALKEEEEEAAKDQ
jgi:predicted ATP-dependent protease